MCNKLFMLIEILLVENNPEDVILIKNTLQENRFFNDINIVKNLEEAANLVDQAQLNMSGYRPDIILISLSSLLSEKAMNAIEDIKSMKFADSDIYILTNDEVEEDILIEHEINYPVIRRPFVFHNFVNTIICKDNYKHAIIKLEN